jgi:hypothetical protein
MKINLNKITAWTILSLLFVLSFSADLKAQTGNTIPSGVKIEVVYFHAPNRCPTCIATENNTKQILEKHFKSEMSKGLITFTSLDLKDEKNEDLVEKYEIVFPTLLILKKQGNKEVKTDYSTKAFQYAYTEPDKYETIFQAEMNRIINIK